MNITCEATKNYTELNCNQGQETQSHGFSILSPLLRAFEIAWIVEGVVLQQPPISCAPRSRHRVAKRSNLSSPKHFDGCKPDSINLIRIYRDRGEERLIQNSSAANSMTHQPPLCSAVPYLTTVRVNNYWLVG